MWRDQSGQTAMEQNQLLNHQLAQFKLDSGIYIPEIYTHKYKQALLGDYGLASYISAEQLFGKKYSIKEIKALLSNYGMVSIFKYLTLLSNYLNLNKVRTIPKDPVQTDFLKKALAQANKLGIPINKIDWGELNHQCTFGVDTVHGLLGLCLSIGFPGEQKVNLADDSGNFFLAMLAINDYVVSPHIVFEPGGDKFHYENLRRIWFYGPLSTTPSDYHHRIHRFVKIANESLVLIDNEKIEDDFKQKYGVNFSDFCALIPALATSGYSKKEWELPDLNCINPDPKAHQILNRALSGLSCSPGIYAERVKELEKKHGETFFIYPDFMSLVIEYPFLHTGEGYYLILGMHFLLRHVELSIDTLAYKQKNNALPKLRSNWGICAEKYARDLTRDKNLP